MTQFNILHEDLQDIKRSIDELRKAILKDIEIEKVGLEWNNIEADESEDCRNVR